MTIMLLLTKDDITTHLNGNNFLITTQGGVQINLTPDAADELINDLVALKEEKGIRVPG